MNTIFLAHTIKQQYYAQQQQNQQYYQQHQQQSVPKVPVCLVESTLANVLDGQIVPRESAEFESSNGSYFTAFQNEIRPSHIIRPTSVADVSAIVKRFHPSLMKGVIRLAVRGAGHTPFAGSSNIQDGITIDMRGLKGISLNEDKTLVEIGVGETWLTVYTALETHGLTVAGGRVGRVGVTGLVLGGGLSLYSTRRGFACDSVVEFEVVTAAGQIVRANAQEHADLWHALRGGLNNFGIVTSFKMKTFKSGDIWGGVTYYAPNAFSQLLQAACDFAVKEKDEDTHIMCSARYGLGNQVVTCVMFSTKGKENPPSLRRFTSLQPQIPQMNTMRMSTHIGFCDELSNFSKDGARQVYMTCTIRPDVALMEAFHTKWQETITKLRDCEGFVFSIDFQPLTKALLRNSQKAGGNAVGLNPEDGPLFIVLLNPVWNLASDDDGVLVEVATLLLEFKQLANENGLLHRYVFTNYAYSHQDIFYGYGEESVAQLKATSQKWDPEGIFQRAVPGGFKLHKTRACSNRGSGSEIHGSAQPS